MNLRYRTNGAFTLIEVLIAVALVSSSLVFVLRSMMASVSGMQLVDEMFTACSFAQQQLWETQLRQKGASEPLNKSTSRQTVGAREFRLDCEVRKDESFALWDISSTVTWKPGKRQDNYAVEVSTCLLPRRK